MTILRSEIIEKLFGIKLASWQREFIDSNLARWTPRRKLRRTLPPQHLIGHNPSSIILDEIEAGPTDRPRQT